MIDKNIMFDFRKKKVRESFDNGKTWHVMDKFSLGNRLHMSIDFYRYLFWDVYKYEELKWFLYEELSEMGENNFII